LGLLATDRGLRAVISTNGTLITPRMAADLKRIGLSYVGVSLDGMKETNDRFRGVAGAFEAALNGIRNCQDAGIKVGLRFTINRRNAANREAISPVNIWHRQRIAHNPRQMRHIGDLFQRCVFLDVGHHLA